MNGRAGESLSSTDGHVFIGQEQTKLPGDLALFPVRFSLANPVLKRRLTRFESSSARDTHDAMTCSLRRLGHGRGYRRPNYGASDSV
jgi:hypothetical protein